MQLAGQFLTVDGAGQVWAGALPMEMPGADANPHLSRLLDRARPGGETKFDAVSNADALKAAEVDNG